jgi:hypothetical protein
MYDDAPRVHMPGLPHASPYTLVGSAVAVGVVSILVLNKQISRSIRAFREGFDKNLLWIYWGLFKEKGWEIFWGPTVLGIIFGFITLWYPPALVWFLAYLVAVFFMTGYYLWRSEYIRLQPKFKVEKIIAQITDTENPSVTNVFLQVLPECVTDAPVMECRARLLLVSQLNGRGEWTPTQMNSPLKLGWDYYGYEPLTIEPGIGQRLNICWWDSRSTAIVPTVEPMPSKWRRIIGPGPFKFDVRMSAKDCAPIDFSVTVNLLGRKWDDPEYSLIRE